jgi:predicted RNA-binding Zn-ribbon protein involved in translation (DUF1610 family)
MGQSSIRDLLASVENTIEARLIGLIAHSKVGSEHIARNNAIPVDVFGMKELVYLDNQLRFLDGSGQHYSLYADCTNEDLVDIIEKEEARQGVRDEQYDLSQEIVDKAGINIVTCGNCGDVMLHRTGHDGDLTCPSCGFESEQGDFPDLFTV